MKNKLLILLTFFIPFVLHSQISIKKLLNESNDDVNVASPDRYNYGNIEVRDFSEELKKEFQAILDDEYAKSGAAGLSCAVIFGEEEWKGVAGISSNTDSMISEMVLGIGSLSKSIAAATVLKLEEEGLLSIDDEVGKWLENREFVDSTITIKQLLNHTSGVYNVTDNPKFVKKINTDFAKIWKPEEVLDTFLLEPYFAPGNGWHYSNSNYILIGMIVEKVTGKKFHEVVRNRILNPYGLDSIYLKPFESNDLEVAHFWADPTGGTNGIDLTGMGISLKALFSGAWAAGAYMARTIDIAKWMKMLASGNILLERSQKEMLTGISLGNNIYYGLGVVYVVDNQGDIFVVGHDGNIGYTTKVYHFIKEDFTVGIQCNDATVNNNTLDNIFTRILTRINSYINSIVFSNESEFLTIYPNPGSDYINIILKEGSAIGSERIKVYNNLGQKVDVSIFESRDVIKIDVSSLAKGMYFVKYGKHLGKFIVE